MSQTQKVDRVSATEYIDITNSGSAPDAPASGTRLYARSGTLYQKTSANATEAAVGSGGIDYGSENLLVRSGDGAGDTEATRATGITVDDSDNITGVASLTLASGATVTAILDEDDLTSDSATALATQQSIKAYVDAQIYPDYVEAVYSSASNRTWNGTTPVEFESITLTEGTWMVFAEGSIYRRGKIWISTSNSTSGTTSYDARLSGSARIIDGTGNYCAQMISGIATVGGGGATLYFMGNTTASTGTGFYFYYEYTSDLGSGINNELRMTAIQVVP